MDAAGAAEPRRLVHVGRPVPRDLDHGERRVNGQQCARERAQWRRRDRGRWSEASSRRMANSDLARPASRARRWGDARPQRGIREVDHSDRRSDRRSEGGTRRERPVGDANVGEATEQGLERSGTSSRNANRNQGIAQRIGWLRRGPRSSGNSGIGPDRGRGLAGDASDSQRTTVDAEAWGRPVGGPCRSSGLRIDGHVGQLVGDRELGRGGVTARKEGDEKPAGYIRRVVQTCHACVDDDSRIAGLIDVAEECCVSRPRVIAGGPPTDRRHFRQTGKR